MARSQIDANEEAAEMAGRRRSRCQVHASEDGDGATRPSRRCRRRSRSQIHGGEDGDGATRPSRRRRRCRATSPEVSVPLPDDGDIVSECRRPLAPWESLPLDMLWEILVLRSPEPPSLQCASAVSTLWRGIATDPNFMSEFRRKWKRRPSLLGFFERRRRKFKFKQDFIAPSERIPDERFFIPRCMFSRKWDVRGCRHGRVLAVHRENAKLVVFAPLIGEACYLEVPSELRPPSCFHLNGAVLCAADDHVHSHGICHLSPFEVVLLSKYSMDNRFITSVYSSETKQWRVVASKEAPCCIASDVPATLVNNRLYWLLSSTNARGVLEFDLGRQSLTVIGGPPGMNDSRNHSVIRQEFGTLGFVVFSFPTMELWQLQNNFQAVDTWFLWKTVDMHNTLGIRPRIWRRVWYEKMIGYDEMTNVIILYVDNSAYMVDLKSMKSTKLDGSRSMNRCHLFTGFYPPDMAI